MEVVAALRKARAERFALLGVPDPQLKRAQLKPSVSDAQSFLTVLDHQKPSRVPFWSYHHPRNKKVISVMKKKTSRHEAGRWISFDGERAVMFRYRGDLHILGGSSLNRTKNVSKKVIVKHEKQAEILFPQDDAQPGQCLVTGLCAVETDLPAAVGTDTGEVASERLHVLSPRTKRKIRLKTAALFRAAPKKNTFITLTFISRIGDEQAVKVLNKFLTAVRSECENLQYLWVAERQMKNATFPNNIHFHLVVNRRLDIVRFNNLWTLQQYNSGLKGYSVNEGRYIEQSEIQSMSEKCLTIQHKINVERDLDKILALRAELKENRVGNYFNPFDIKPVKTIEGLACYLTKYITKNEGSFKCAAWRCSRGVSMLYTDTKVQQGLFDDLLTEKNTFVNKETGELFEPKIVYDPGQFCAMIYVYNKEHYSQYLAEMDMVNKWILSRELIPDVGRVTNEFYRQKIMGREFLN